MSNNTTYDLYNLKINILIKKYLAFSKKVKLSIGSCSFPFLFATPKFHKNPLKFRFICSNFGSIGNNFNNKFETILKKILNILKFKYKNDSCFWILDNSYGVLNNIDNITSVQTYDFENLFTNIPISDLHQVLVKVFDIIGADSLNISRDFFIDLCRFCLYNNYVCTGNKIYLQINGIGMGTSYSSTAANLFLFYYEFNFCSKPNNFIARRYIDDVIVFNLNSNFSDIANIIYPNCLTLKKTNSNNNIANFMDLHLDLNFTPVFCSIYDKRVDFPFDVISLIHWSSNIHKRIYSNTILSQVFRFLKICNYKSALSKQIYYFSAKLYYENNIPFNFIQEYLPSCIRLLL